MSRKKNKLFGELALVVLSIALMSGTNLLYPASASSFEIQEYQITTNTASQQYPDISIYNIVYQDDRNGNWDIYVSNIAGATTESRLTTNPSNQMAPAISGSLVVYQDSRNGNWDIYLYNLTSQSETRITTSSASQTNPEIEGNNIVWQDNRNGNSDIYMYNLSTGIERRVTTSSSDEQNPAISGNLIAYDKWITVSNILTQAVYYYDIIRNIETQVSSSGDTNNNPAIYGTRVVYQSSRASELDTLPLIVMRDLVNTTYSWEAYSAYNPDVSENYVVYEDHSSFTTSGYNIIYNSNIYLLQINSRVETQITTNTKDQLNPKVSGGRIVYMDNRNGNWDIYMTVTVVAIAEPTRTPLPRLGAAGPGNSPSEVEGSQSEPEGFSLSPSTAAMIAAFVVIAVVVASITLTLYYKKHHSEMSKRKEMEAT